MTRTDTVMDSILSALGGRRSARYAGRPNRRAEPADAAQDGTLPLWDVPIQYRGDEDTAVDFREEVLIEKHLRRPRRS
jgi:hypothetical protein